MRIVQLIDSLEPGGAERMAVNLANVLADKIAFSGLIVSRNEGDLRRSITTNVKYYFLNKKRTIDIKAIFSLRKYVIENQVGYIHAHSSSFFLATLLKVVYPKIKIIWHDHYGNSEFLDERPKYMVQFASFFFSGIIAVNEKLLTWDLASLRCENGIYLANFAVLEKGVPLQTKLHGQAGKRIVCLANLRPQKNHFLVLDVASKLKQSHPEWSFHLIGKDFQDGYSQELKANIKQQQLEHQVFLYDSCTDIAAVLDQAQIGILTSNSEGLPVALLEYALHKKAVVLTKVGQVGDIVEENLNGFLVPSKDKELFYQRVVELIEDNVLQENFAEKLHQKVLAHFSVASIIKKYIHWIRTTIVHE